MAILDRRTGSVVLRIVYDGPPEAGKTTNLQRLCDRVSLARRGELASPGGGNRTQYFDWLDVEGGYVAGRRLRCQLVSVPGQIELARRRRYLLDGADVVVFVSDARPVAVTTSQLAVASLVRALGERPVSLLVQANKQDLPGALAPEALRDALALDRGVPVVGAQASEGVGVLETFMLAVRLAVDRVRADVAQGRIDEDDPVTAEAALATMSAADAAALEALAASAAALVTGAAAVETPALAPPPADAPLAPPAPAARPAPAEASAVIATAPAMPEAPAAAAPPPPPRAPPTAAPANPLTADLPHGGVGAGLVWPAASGRAVLREFDRARADTTAVTVEDGHLRCGRWRLWRHPDSWDDIDLGRRALLDAVGRQPALADAVPVSRTLALVATAEERFVLWHLVETEASLAEVLAARPDDAAARCERARALVRRLAPLAQAAGIGLDVSPATLDGDGFKYLGPSWPSATVPVEVMLARIAEIETVAETTAVAEAETAAETAAEIETAAVPATATATATETETVPATETETETETETVAATAAAAEIETATATATVTADATVTVDATATVTVDATVAVDENATATAAVVAMEMVAMTAVEGEAAAKEVVEGTGGDAVEGVEDEVAVDEVEQDDAASDELIAIGGLSLEPAPLDASVAVAVAPLVPPPPPVATPRAEVGIALPVPPAHEVVVAQSMAPAPLVPPPPPVTVARAEVVVAPQAMAATASTVAPPPRTPPPARDQRWTIPHVDLPAGAVWPPVKGRLTLAALGEPCRPNATPRPWAPAGAIEFACGDGWLLHTSSEWYFDDVDPARRALLELVRWQRRLAELVPPTRTVALCPDGVGTRLWLITPDLPSCHERVEAARAGGDAGRVATELEQGAAALARVRAELIELDLPGLALAIDVDAVTVDGRARLLLATDKVGAKAVATP